MNFIPFLIVLSLSSDAVCKPTKLYKLFDVPTNASRTELYQRKEAPRNTFSFYVSLRRKKNGRHFCAGTLISPYYILTSASCVDRGRKETTAKEITVDIGTHSMHRPENAKKRTTAASWTAYIPEYGMKVEKVMVHEKYSNGTEGSLPYDARYDIAILKLKERSRHRWALLPLEDLDCCDGEDLLNVGLGRVESEVGDYAESLEMAVFPYMPHKKCKAYFRARPKDEFFGNGNEGNLTASTSLCVSGEGEYCQLDKGSSLVRYNSTRDYSVIVGLANEATRECSYGAPYVFSSISSHMEWIFGAEGVVKDVVLDPGTRFILAAMAAGYLFSLARTVDAQSGRFPYAASVRSTPFPHAHRCDGVLISPKHVLTAASCIPDEDYSLPREITVYIGGIHTTPALDSDGELITAAEIVAHPQYRANRNAVNLAIITLKEKSTKKPVRLPVRSRECCESGTSMRVFGWGSQPVETEFSPFLQTGEMSYISRKQCVSVHGVRDINRKAFCAGNRFFGAILCRGRYGTPVLLTGGAEDVLIGIGFTNVTSDCGQSPAEFLRIAFFMRWIKKHVSKV